MYTFFPFVIIKKKKKFPKKSRNNKNKNKKKYSFYSFPQFIRIVQMQREEYYGSDYDARDGFADWLDDDTIDGCCQAVVSMCTSDELVGTNSVFFVSSLAVTVALKRLRSRNATQKTVRRALGIVASKQKTWPPRDLVCFSINNGAHWSLLVYFPGYTKHKIYHYDSGRHFPGGGNVPYAVKVVQMLARIRLVPTNVRLVNEVGFPIQDGSVECGYYLVAAMANLFSCRRENLDCGRVVGPINSYNLNLLHEYDLTKLQRIVKTLLFRHNQEKTRNQPNHHHHHHNNKRKRPKKKSTSQQKQQQTISSHKRTAAAFSFDDDDDDDGDVSPSIPKQKNSPRSKRERRK